MLTNFFYKSNLGKSTFSVLLFIISLSSATKINAQTFVFAQLSGSPVNTTGWNLQGDAVAGNLTGTGNSEIILTPARQTSSGAIFYNQPINLSLCNKWAAEFDFRMFDGSAADGLAFCFLDTPPAGFVTGGGLGIPSTANGLKICFDTYPNCNPQNFSILPKIEIRWGIGYDECNGQPTIDNSTGTLSLIRSATYNHAKVTYDNGTINVYVNNTLYLTGFQQFNFAGYLGFTAGTGGMTDNHSIKNVIIYTNMPGSKAGAAQSICSGNSVQVGTADTSTYVYTWTPSAGVSNTTVSNPTITLSNDNSAVDISRKYYVQTAFASAPGCASEDSVVITVNASLATLSIASPATDICKGTPVTFTATSTNGGSAPFYQWKLNGINVGTNNSTYTNNSLDDGDVISCVLTSNDVCLKIDTVVSNSIKIIVHTPAVTSISITVSTNNICPNTVVNFTATPENGGSAPVYQWQVNGVNTGIDSIGFSSNKLNNGDVISCTMTSNLTCIVSAVATSNKITMIVNPIVSPTVSITASANNICPDSLVTFSAAVVNGGTNPSYQWLINGKDVGFNNTVYSNSSLLNNDTVSCFLSGSIACSLPAISNTISMNVYPAPVINMVADKVIKYAGSIVLDPIVTGNIASYLWSPADGLSNATVLSPTANPLATMVYQLNVSSTDGCNTSAKITVNVFIPLQMPTAFTPNRDGVNDVFRIPPFIPLQINYFSIYNRWGNEIFSTKNSGNGWDGTYYDMQQPAGVYIWMIEYKNLLTGKFEKQNGTVMLIR